VVCVDGSVNANANVPPPVTLAVLAPLLQLNTEELVDELQLGFIDRNRSAKHFAVTADQSTDRQRILAAPRW
jgi:hypothetical protein